jgi:hypothetical protein
LNNTHFVLLELQICFKSLRNLSSTFYQHFIISVTLVLLPLLFLATKFDVRHFTFILNIGILLSYGVHMQLGLAIDSPKATLAVKMRLACEMVKYWHSRASRL